MAWTQSDVDTLKAAIARGVKSVQMNGERVEYSSNKEMLQTLALMQAEVSGVSRGDFIFVYPTTSRGL